MARSGSVPSGFRPYQPWRRAPGSGARGPTETVGEGGGEVSILPDLPGMGAAFWRGAVPGRRRPAAVAAQQVVVPGHLPDAEALARYSRVCGFTLRDVLPPTWLHVLTFPLHLHLLSDPATTLPLAGLVHVRNRMRSHRLVQVSEQLELQSGIGNLRSHRRGALVDLTGEVRVGDELVWEGVSTYLARGVEIDGTAPVAGAASPATALEGRGGPAGASPGVPVALWRLPAELGRRYRDVSGDPNPIHTSRLAAKAFGFARPIAHGMWTHARLLAALENRLPASYQIEVDFLRPILLPATVGFVATARENGWEAAVTTRDGGRSYLLARIDFR